MPPGRSRRKDRLRAVFVAGERRVATLTGMFERLVALGVAALLLSSCGDDPNALRSGARGPRTSTASGADTGDEPTDESGTSPGDDGTGGSAGSGSTGGAGTPSATTAEQICVDAINEYRKTLNLPPLARWTAAETCSSDQASSDSTTNRGHGAFGKCRESAQNECPAWPGPASKMIPQCLKAMWGEGPGGGHYENMASRKWTKVACGFSSGSSVWAVQNFQ